MFARFGKLVLPLFAGALVLGGCESVTGTQRGDETRVVLVRSGSASASLAPSLYAAVAAAMPAPVSLSNVESIDITLTRVQVLPQGENAEGEGKWVTLDLTTPTSVDFLALPTDASSGGLEVARGDLPAGTYGNLRFFFADATVTFKEEVRVGQTVYPADTPIDIVIPSGRIRVPTGSFTVTETSGSTIQVVFDAAASVHQVVATGANKIILPPVLTAREAEED